MVELLGVGSTPGAAELLGVPVGRAGELLAGAPADVAAGVVEPLAEPAPGALLAGALLAEPAPGALLAGELLAGTLLAGALLVTTGRPGTERATGVRTVTFGSLLAGAPPGSTGVAYAPSSPS